MSILLKWTHSLHGVARICQEDMHLDSEVAAVSFGEDSLSLRAVCSSHCGGWTSGLIIFFCNGKGGSEGHGWRVTSVRYCYHPVWNRASLGHKAVLHTWYRNSRTCNGVHSGTYGTGLVIRYCSYVWTHPEYAPWFIHTSYTHTKLIT